MLLECQHCGAPLDVARNDKLTRCKYCGTISRVKALKTVADETPPDFRPPQQWTPPANAHADPAKVLTYHASWAIGRLIRTIVFIVVLLAMLPIVIPLVIGLVLTAATSTKDVQETINAAQGAIELARQQVANMTAGQAAAGVNLLTSDGAAGAIEQYRAKIGSNKLKALRLVMHPTHAVLDAQDPAKPTHIDRYTYRAGVVSDPSPVNVQSLGKRLDRALFDMDDVVLDRMSELTEKTLTELKYDQATVSHVIVDRASTSSGKVVIRVYASGPRESGRVEFNADGSKSRVYR